MNKKQKHLSQVYTLLVTVRLFMTMRVKDTTSLFASNAVRTGIVGAYNACGHGGRRSEFKDQNGISIYSLMVSTGLTLEKAKAAG